VVTAAALFAGQTQRALRSDRANRPDAQINRSRVCSGYIDGIRQAWVASYSGVFDEEPTGMVVDNSGNVYVTGRTTIPDFSAYVTIKYNPQGQEEWSSTYNPPNCISSAAGIAIDDLGNVYVTGTSQTFGLADADYVTIKYNNSGQQQWIARYNGGPNSSDNAAAIAVDGSGNVYVTGTSDGDYATVKYDSSGQQQWLMRYNGPGNSSDNAVAIVVDVAGNVYVTGSSVGTGAGADYVTIKYDNSGQQEWVARYSGPGVADQPAGMAIDRSGNVYVTGTSWGSRGISISECATIKYNNSGKQQWVASYNGPGNGSQANAIGIDGSGNVYVTGASLGLDNISDYATIKYNSAGQQQWANRYRAPGSSGDFATAIAVSSSGNVYITGQSSGDYGTIKYNALGQEQWVERYNGPQGFDDYARVLSVDRRENVYVTGAIRQSEFQYDWDFATIKYMPDRIPLPQARP
jgi:beta-propeller repeat-containing protein